MLVHTIKLNQSAFSKAPERPDSAPIGKFIPAVVHAVMFVISHIYQPVIAAPAVTMNHALRSCFFANNALKRLFPSIWHLLRMTLPWRLKMPKTMVFPEAPRPCLPGGSRIHPLRWSRPAGFPAQTSA